MRECDSEPFCEEARQERDQLRAENERLRSALEEIAHMDTGSSDSDTEAMCRMMNIATAALGSH